MLEKRWILLCLLLALVLHMFEVARAAPNRHLKITAEGDTPKLIVMSEEDIGVEPKRLVAAKSKYDTKTTTQQPTAILVSFSDVTSAVATAANATVKEENSLSTNNTLILTTTTTTTRKPIIIEHNAAGVGNLTLVLTPLLTTKHTEAATTIATTQLTPPITTTILSIPTTNLSEHNGSYINITGREHNQYESIKNVPTSVAFNDLQATTVKSSENVKEKEKDGVDDNLKKRKFETLSKDIKMKGDNFAQVYNEPKISKKVNKIGILPVMEGAGMQEQIIATDSSVSPEATDDQQSTVLQVSNSNETTQQNKNSKYIAASNENNNNLLLPHTTNPPIKFHITSSSTPKVQQTMASADVMLNYQQKQKQQQQQHEDVLTLIDLEKPTHHVDIFDRKQEKLLLKQKHIMATTSPATQQLDVAVDADLDGHDGIKKTKKKQLKIDKHVLADIALSTNSPLFAASSSGNNAKVTQFPLLKENSLPLPKRMGLKGETYIESHFSTEDKQTFSNKLFELEDTRATTNKPFLTERTESKISDIQVEVYDSTIDTLVDFNKNQTTINTTKLPVVATSEQKFTQYVVDRVESSTQESNLLDLDLTDIGKPEPAAIEIHINVSEGVGNASEDLEFSYPQNNFENIEANNLKKPVDKISENPQQTNRDEILVVEVIGPRENVTEYSASAEIVSPRFTFHTDINEAPDRFNLKLNGETNTRTDEIFMTNLNSYKGKNISPIAATPHLVKPIVDHDSDTIFYISNTEVKVGESKPTSNTYVEQQKSYLLSTHATLQQQQQQLQQQKTKFSHRFEEDILLSPLQNTADSLKIFRSQNENEVPPLDVTYVGESVMEVEQQVPSSDTVTATTTSTTTETPETGHVIIQPASLSEIGVPVIGELPPQIELKEFDFMPDELTNHEKHEGVSGAEDEEEDTSLNGNDVERLVESSIQYGADLIDEGAVAGGAAEFDGAEGAYPFGNMADIQHHHKPGSHFMLNHGVNNFRKDILSVDVNVGNLNETTLKETEVGNRTVNDANMNTTLAMANVTAASIIENPKMTSLNANEECEY